MHRGIQIKLLAAFLTIIFILTISAAFQSAVSLSIINKYDKTTEDIMSEYSIIETTNNFILDFKNFIKYSGDQAEKDKLLASRDALQALITKVSAIDSVSGSNTEVYTGLKSTLNKLIAEINLGIDEITAGDYSTVYQHYDNANKLNAFIKEGTSQILLQQLQNTKILETKVDVIKLWSDAAAVAMFIIILLGCIWYSFKFSHRLVEPLRRLTKLAKDIEFGNINAKIENNILQSDDEVGSLANSFNTMVLSLRQDINKLKEYNLEIKTSRNLLKSEKNKLQQYLDIAGVIVLIFSPNDNKVSLINKNGLKILGISSKDVMKKDWVDLFVSKNYKTQTKSFLGLFAGGITSSDTLENVIVGSEKKEKNIIWHFSVLKKDDGADEDILATGVDVTELTAAKITINQLKELDRFKNEVMNIATHELKTPLISIVGLSEVMEKKSETLAPDFKNYISIIHQEGLKLNNLIKTMLSSSRNELGKMAVVREKINLSDLLVSLETPLNILTKRSNSKVVLQIESKETNTESDKAKISQVIYNFVDNAVKYGPKNQTITVKLNKPDDNTVKIAVSDMGKGISEDDQKKIFTKFSQLEPSLSRSQEGMGLGLYICKQNIEGLGGKIGVVSELNKGATFFFTLPLNNK